MDWWYWLPSSLLCPRYLQVLLAIGLLWTQSELSPLFRINLEVFHLLAGFSTCPLACPRLLSYLKHSWFVSICHYLLECQCNLTTKKPTYFDPRCVHDEVIMDVLEREHLPKRWIEACNRCHIFLHAITISDISTASGTKILETALHYSARLPSTLQWPTQAQPSKRDWSLWKKCLLQYFIGNQSFCLLKQPLGRWFSDPLLHHQVWNAGISIDNNAVFI